MTKLIKAFFNKHAKKLLAFLLVFGILSSDFAFMMSDNLHKNSQNLDSGQVSASQDKKLASLDDLKDLKEVENLFEIKDLKKVEELGEKAYDLSLILNKDLEQEDLYISIVNHLLIDNFPQEIQYKLSKAFEELDKNQDFALYKINLSLLEELGYLQRKEDDLILKLPLKLDQTFNSIDFLLGIQTNSIRKSIFGKDFNELLQAQSIKEDGQELQKTEVAPEVEDKQVSSSDNTEVTQEPNQTQPTIIEKEEKKKEGKEKEADSSQKLVTKNTISISYTENSMPKNGGVFLVERPDGTSSELVTDSQGPVNLEISQAGKYTIKQTQAPVGYGVDPQIKNLEITQEAKDQVYKVEFQADPFNNRVLEIELIDEVTGKPLSDTKLLIIDAFGNQHPITTDKDGKAKLESLQTGDYIITIAQEDMALTGLYKTQGEQPVQVGQELEENEIAEVLGKIDQLEAIKASQAGIMTRSARSAQDTINSQTLNYIDNSLMISVDDGDDIIAVRALANRSGPATTPRSFVDIRPSIKFNNISYGYQMVDEGGKKYIYWTFDMPVVNLNRDVNYAFVSSTVFENSGLGRPEVVKAEALKNDSLDQGRRTRFQTNLNKAKTTTQDLGGLKTVHHAYGSYGNGGTFRNNEGVDYVRYTVKTPIEEYRSVYALEVYGHFYSGLTNYAEHSDRLFASFNDDQLDPSLLPDPNSYRKEDDISHKLTPKHLELFARLLNRNNITKEDLVAISPEGTTVDDISDEHLEEAQKTYDNFKNQKSYHTLTGDYVGGFGSDQIKYTYWVNPANESKGNYKPIYFKDTKVGDDTVSFKDVYFDQENWEPTNIKVDVYKNKEKINDKESPSYFQVSSNTYSSLDQVPAIPSVESKENYLIKYEITGRVKEHTYDHRMGGAIVESKQVVPKISVDWSKNTDPAKIKEIEVSGYVDGTLHQTVRTKGNTELNPVNKFTDMINGKGRKKFDAKESAPTDLIVVGRSIDEDGFTASFRLRDRRDSDRDPSKCPPMGGCSALEKPKDQYGVTYIEPINFKHLEYVDINLGFFKANYGDFLDSLRGGFALPQGSKKGEYYTLELPKEIMIMDEPGMRLNNNTSISEFTNRPFFHIRNKNKPNEIYVDVYLDEVEASGKNYGPYENKMTHRLRFVVTEDGEEATKLNDLFATFEVGEQLPDRMWNGVKSINGKHKSSYNHKDVRTGIEPLHSYFNEGANSYIKRDLEFVGDFWENSQQEINARRDSKKLSGNEKFLTTPGDITFPNSWRRSRGHFTPALFTEDDDSITVEYIFNPGDIYWQVRLSHTFTLSSRNLPLKKNSLQYYSSNPIQDLQIFEFTPATGAASYVAGSERLVWSHNGPKHRQFNARKKLGDSRFGITSNPAIAGRDGRVEHFIIRVKYKKGVSLATGKENPQPPTKAELEAWEKAQNKPAINHPFYAKGHYHSRNVFTDSLSGLMLGFKWAEYMHHYAFANASAEVSDPESLEIIKLDKDTNKSIPGVKFNLYETIDGIDWCIGTYETDQNGKFTINNLWPGKTYYLKEVEAPEGYNLPEGGLIFKLGENTDGSFYLIDQDNKKIESLQTGEPPIYPIYNEKDLEVKLRKLDLHNKSRVLPRVEFIIKYVDQGQAFDENTAKPLGQNQGLFKTDQKGEIVLTGVEVGKDYYIQEVKGHPEYEFNEEKPWIGPIRIKVEDDQGQRKVSIDLSGISEDKMPKHDNQNLIGSEANTILVYNIAKPNINLRIFKYEGGELKKPIKKGTLSLKISKLQGTDPKQIDQNFTPIIKDFDLADVNSYEPNTNNLKWDNLDLASGHYILEEEKAPQDYVKTGNKFHLIVDRPNAKVTLHKVYTSDFKEIPASEIILAERKLESENYVYTYNPLEIENYKPVYPETGGQGSLYIILAGFIISLVAIYLYRRKYL